LQTQLTIFISIDGLYVDGTFKSAPKFLHQLFIDLPCATCIFLTGQ